MTPICPYGFGFLEKCLSYLLKFVYYYYYYYFFFFYYIIILYFAATTAIHCVNKNKKHKNIANRNDKESKVQYHKDSKLYIPHCNTIEE